MDKDKRFYKVRTLGDLIDVLKKCPLEYKWAYMQEPEACLVYFDFCNVAPKYFDSYRGDYSELALVPNIGDEGRYRQMSVSGFLKMCEDTVGAIFEGYKGGEYRMSRDCEIWVDKEGDATGTKLIGVLVNGSYVYLVTCMQELVGDWKVENEQ